MRLNIITSILLHGIAITIAFALSGRSTVCRAPAAYMTITLVEVLSGAQEKKVMNKQVIAFTETLQKNETRNNDLERFKDTIKTEGRYIDVHIPGGYRDTYEGVVPTRDTGGNRSEDKKSDGSEDGGFHNVNGSITYALIKDRIEKAKVYPALARRKGIEGKVFLRFRIRPNGEVEEVRIIKSSGSEILDKTSIETIKRSAPLPYVAGWIELPLSFRLE